MAEFKIIETQEELDKIVGERAIREKEKFAKVEENYKKEIEELQKTLTETEAKIGELTEKQNGHNDEVAKLTAELAGLKLNDLKHRIANEYSLPYELAGRLTGEDEDSLKKDAENLKKYVGIQRTAPPLATPEVEPEDSKKSDFRSLAKKIAER